MPTSQPFPYRLGRLVGSGHCSRVYALTDDSQTVVKILSDRAAWEREGKILRFFAEHGMSEGLVPKIYESGECADGFFIAMSRLP